jgi:precorrin-6y C5,15-methyltransferase (decarboxylating) CbiE subunit
MALSVGQILIVGCGPGAKAYVSPAANEAAMTAEVLMGAGRLLELFPQSGAQKIEWHGRVDEMLDELAGLLEQGRRPAVLVSGDPGLFSLARRIVERFGASVCQIVPAVSSIQVAFARLGLDWANAKIASAHGRLPTDRPADMARHEKIAVLAGTQEALAWCGQLAGELGQTHAAFVCEDLTLNGERVRRMEAGEIAGSGATPLTIVLLVKKELVS